MNLSLNNVVLNYPLFALTDVQKSATYRRLHRKSVYAYIHHTFTPK